VETNYPGMRAVWCVGIVWRALFRRYPKWLNSVTGPLSRWKTIGGDQLVISFRKTAKTTPVAQA
jgi:hypothetical protein